MRGWCGPCEIWMIVEHEFSGDLNIWRDADGARRGGGLLGCNRSPRRVLRRKRTRLLYHNRIPSLRFDYLFHPNHELMIVIGVGFGGGSIYRIEMESVDPRFCTHIERSVYCDILRDGVIQFGEIVIIEFRFAIVMDDCFQLFFIVPIDDCSENQITIDIIEEIC